MLPLDPADLLLRISFQDEEGRNILTKAGYLISRFFKENILISHVSKESLAWFGLVWFGLGWFGLVWSGLRWLDMVRHG